MSTVKLAFLGIAVVIGIPMVSALAAQQLSADTATELPCHAALSAPVILHGKRLGLEGVFAPDETALTGLPVLNYAGAIAKPGRA